MQLNEKQTEKQTTRVVKPPKRRLFLNLKKISTQHEAQKIVNHYQQAVSKIPEVKEVRYKIRKNSIEFVVRVDRIRRKLSHRLSQIEGELCDEYTEWFFEFEHLSSPTLPRQYRGEYPTLFSSE